MSHGVRRTRWQEFRIVAVAITLSAVGAVTAGVVVSSRNGRALAEAAPVSSFVPIEQVTPNVKAPPLRRNGSAGVFTVDCGTNENGKFSPDNPVAQPGVSNGAQHVHDFVGNLSITADSTDESLAASDTTCRNGDRSSYFWPVVRIDPQANRQANPVGADAGSLRAAGPGAVSCPTARDKMPAVPARAADEVNRNLALLDRQIAEANQRLVTSQGEGGPNFVNNAILGPLRDKRTATLDRIAIAIGRHGARPTGLAGLAPCSLDNAGSGAGPTPSASASAGGELPGVQGPNLEIAGNVGVILRPTSVKIEYRGNPTTKVVAMPRFLRALTGESKPTSRGPANARASWTCSGFTDRLTDRYPICPPGSQVMRVHDFASCWDGENTDSANHRDHIRFPDAATGACPAGTFAVPQLRIAISYDIPLDVQRNGQYQLDSFPEENHNPASDHNDFINVNSTRQMAKIVYCVNAGRRCR